MLTSGLTKWIDSYEIHEFNAYEWGEAVKEIWYATFLEVRRIYGYEVQIKYDFHYHYRSCSLSLLKRKKF
jgi:hypothetical protein